MGIVMPTCHALCDERKFDRARIEDDFFRTYGKPRPDIEHVVVLMLENRTFDNIYGNWMDQRMARGEVRPSKWDTNALQGKRLLRDYQNVVVDRSGRRTIFPVWTPARPAIGGKYPGKPPLQ